MSEAREDRKNDKIHMNIAIQLHEKMYEIASVPNELGRG
jgi:hypothetical protein